MGRPSFTAHRYIASATQTYIHTHIYCQIHSLFEHSHTHTSAYASARVLMHTNAISSSQMLQNKEKTNTRAILFFYNQKLQNKIIMKTNKQTKFKSKYNLPMHNFFGGKLIKRFFFALLLISHNRNSNVCFFLNLTVLKFQSFISFSSTNHQIFINLKMIFVVREKKIDCTNCYLLHDSLIDPDINDNHLI